MAETTPADERTVTLNPAGGEPRLTVFFNGHELITYGVRREDGTAPLGVLVGEGDNVVFDESDTFPLKVPAAGLVGKRLLIMAEFQSPDAGPVVRYRAKMTVTQDGVTAGNGQIIWEGLLNGTQTDAVAFPIKFA